MTTENRRQNPQPFSPVKGEEYENAGGGRYLCDSVQSSGKDCNAWMINVASGWTCYCKGIVRYDDGTIEWDRSVGGHFIEPDNYRLEQIDRVLAIHRQRSIVNAMLCMI